MTKEKEQHGRPPLRVAITIRESARFCPFRDIVSLLLCYAIEVKHFGTFFSLETSNVWKLRFNILEAWVWFSCVVIFQVLVAAVILWRNSWKMKRF